MSFTHCLANGADRGGWFVLRQKTQVGGRSNRAVVARPMGCWALEGESKGDRENPESNGRGLITERDIYSRGRVFHVGWWSVSESTLDCLIDPRPDIHHHRRRTTTTTHVCVVVAMAHAPQGGFRFLLLQAAEKPNCFFLCRQRARARFWKPAGTALTHHEPSRASRARFRRCRVRDDRMAALSDIAVFES